MAERRMLSSKVVCSDAFIEMPFSAQALYTQLVMEADDDGFLNRAKRIQMSIGAKPDDLEMLIQKRFILAFPNGVVVIKHWRMNNQIRKDRYTPTQYQEEFNSLDIKSDGAYTEREKDSLVDALATTWQPLGNQTATQDRLGKVSIDKFSIDNMQLDSDESEQPAPQKPKKKKSVKDKYGEFQNVLLTNEEYEKLADDFGADLRDKAMSFLDAYIEEKGYKSKSHNLAIRRWVIDAVRENESKPQRYGGRKEKVPGWLAQEGKLGEAEMSNIRRLMAENESPEAQQERDRLAEELKAFGRKDGA